MSAITTIRELPLLTKVRRLITGRDLHRIFALPAQSDSVCCNGNCRQGRDCPVRMAQISPARDTHRRSHHASDLE